jgi:hypothetical protein
MCGLRTVYNIKTYLYNIQNNHLSELYVLTNIKIVSDKFSMYKLLKSSEIQKFSNIDTTLKVSYEYNGKSYDNIIFEHINLNHIRDLLV